MRASEKGVGRPMKHLAQNYRSGELTVIDAPPPTCVPGGVLVRSLYSLISTGTEMMKVGESKMSLVGKARARPDQVKKVLETVQQQGPLTAYKKAMSRLDSYSPLGYSLCRCRRSRSAGGRGVLGRSARGVRGERARAPRRDQLGADQSLCGGARRGLAPAGGVRHRGLHRHCRGFARRARRSGTPPA